MELSDSKHYRCGACGVTYSTTSAKGPGDRGRTPSEGLLGSRKARESYRLPEQEKYPIAIKINLRDAYGRLSSENQGVPEHEGPVRAEIEKVDKECK